MKKQLKSRFYPVVRNETDINSGIVDKKGVRGEPDTHNMVRTLP